MKDLEECFAIIDKHDNGSSSVFAPEDFKRSMDQKPIVWPDGWQLMADVANAKLELPSDKIIWLSFPVYNEMVTKLGKRARHIQYQIKGNDLAGGFLLEGIVFLPSEFDTGYPPVGEK